MKAQRVWFPLVLRSFNSWKVCRNRISKTAWTANSLALLLPSLVTMRAQFLGGKKVWIKVLQWKIKEEMPQISSIYLCNTLAFTPSPSSFHSLGVRKFLEGLHGGLGREAGSWDWEGDGQRWRITPRSTGVEPETPGKAQQSRKAGFRFFLLFDEFSGSLGEGRDALSWSKCAGGWGETTAAAGLGAVTFPPTGGLGCSWRGLPRAREGRRAEGAGRHGGTDPVQRPGHAAVVRAALAGWSLASDRGEEGAKVLAARAAQPLAPFGDCSHPQVQAWQRLQMVSAPGEREGAEFPGTVLYGTHRQPENPSPRSPLTLYSDSDPLCPLR